MKYLQKLGKALMLPVSCLPVCGLLMGLGYLLCPSAMQGGSMNGIAEHIGYFLVTAGGALINNMALLFAVGVGVGMSENNDGTGALAALVSWLMITTLLGKDTVTALLPSVAGNADKVLAFSKTANPFIGILSGIIGSASYNRFKSTRLPNWLSFFSGKRCVAIIAAFVSIAASFILLFAWPFVFGALSALGERIAGLGAFAAGLYAFLNRLLIPTGLHHALNNVFWFDTTGLGDLSHFWAGHTSADVSWSLGMYMSGFFPCMMFGVPGAALAMVRYAKPEKKKAAVGILLSCAVCSFVCGVTEPFEFSFMFLSPLLYVIYALMYGLITFLTVISGFRAGFSFSGGVLDLVFSASLPAAARTWMILPLGLLSFVMFYAVFSFLILRRNLKTPGREDDDAALPQEPNTVGAGTGNAYAKMAEIILRGLGGAGNVLSVDNCITRLRLELADPSLVDDALIRSSGAAGVIRPGKNSVQVVIGTTVQFVADELRTLWEAARAGAGSPAAAVPAGTDPRTVPAPAGADPGTSAGSDVRAAGAAAGSDIRDTENTASANAQAPAEPVRGAQPRRKVTHSDLIFEEPAAVLRDDGFDFVISDPSGIHARPAGMMVHIVGKYDCEITVSADGKTCPVRNVVDLMSLGAGCGTKLAIRACGPDASAALQELLTYMRENL